MTPEEMELAIRVLQQKVERYEEAADQVDLWRVNGAENLLGGYGFTQIGANFRFTGEDLQVRSESALTSLLWLRSFLTNFSDTSDYPYMRMLADMTSGAAAELTIEDKFSAADSSSAQFTVETDDAAVILRADTTDNTARLDIGAQNTAGGYFVRLNATPLWLGVFTADPAVVSDGMMWYRSDTDKFRVRLNGVTYNLNIEGTTILGDGSELTIATGAITITSGYHRVDTQSDGGTDDLDTISGGTTGQMLVLRAENAARTVVVKNGTGNIQLDGAADFSLDDVQDTVSLLYDGTNWLEISRSDNG